MKIIKKPSEKDLGIPPYEFYKEDLFDLNDKLEEGFRAGKTSEMIVKLMDVIGRKARISEINVSPVPDYYSNRYGTFVGFFTRYNGNNILRFNFLRKGASNKFYSIDKYDLKKMKPEYTIDLQGFNVVEVVGYVADVLTGDYWEYAESTKEVGDRTRLTEAVTFKDSVAEWIESNSTARSDLRQAIESKNLRKIKDELEKYLPIFERFLADNNRRGSRNMEHSFRYAVKGYFENRERVDGSAIPTVEVQPGSPENLNSVSSERDRAFDEFLENEHIIKFQALRTYCFQIRNNNPKFKSLYIYGDGGIGKTFWVKKILANLPNARMTTGKLSGYTGLIQLLYDNRDEKILIMDDTLTPKDMTNETIQNILKAVLDPDPPRKIEVIRAQRRRSESYFDKGKFYLNERDYTEFETWKKSLKEETEFVDLTEPIIDDTPNEFLYNSITVFITNYKQVPQPVQDRCWILQMEFNNKQILDIIEESLKTAVPEADIETLNEAYKLVEVKPSPQEALSVLRDMETKGVIPRKLSHRVFNRILALMEIDFDDPNQIHNYIRIELGN